MCTYVLGDDWAYVYADFCFFVYQDDGLVGDAFMNQVQPIAAYLPYMTSVGNHEQA